MTKAEVETLIQEELRRAMGSRAGLLNLRETDSQRVAREAAEDQREKQAKRERKAQKRLQESGRAAFMALGMSKREAKLAARGREFRG
jgi:hypothetical protein